MPLEEQPLSGAKNIITVFQRAMQERLVDTVELDNGIKVEIWDLSRRLAGDRWLVSLEARVDIPLAPDMLPPTPEREKFFQVLLKVFGGKIPYRYKQERHFVDEKEKDALFKEFISLLNKNVIPYLSHKEFAKRLALSKIRELKSKDPRLFL